MMIQETLTRPDNTFNPLPAAATSWSVDKSGLVWTIQLRRGMVWSDDGPDWVAEWRLASEGRAYQWQVRSVTLDDGFRVAMGGVAVAATER